METVLKQSDIIVIGNGDKEFSSVPDKVTGDKKIVDLVRISERTSEGKYDGICW
jgi:GDP-mannose 6-dehydrogenase